MLPKLNLLFSLAAHDLDAGRLDLLPQRDAAFSSMYAQRTPMQDLSSIDLIWLLCATVLVFVMQAGFSCLESGLCRSKNSINVAAKNLIDLCIGGFSFWIVGFGLMFGRSWMGLVGTDKFFFGGPESSATMLAFFMFQVVFSSTSITICSGAVAERMRFKVYAIFVIAIGAIIYPIFGHWAWYGFGDDSQHGWLLTLGFRDFAGSTVVHSVGAWCALAGVIMVGPRLGRYRPDGTAQAFTQSNSTFAALGAFLLWFGWFGFNGGSTLAFNGQVPLILLNTFLGGCCGAVAVLAVLAALGRVIRVEFLINGVLAGLVSVTANCNLATPVEAVLIASMGGILCLFAQEILENRLRLDDAVGAVTVHGVAGIWGTLAVAFVLNESEMTAGETHLSALGVQALGCLVCFVWSFGLSMIYLIVLRNFMPLRVTEEEEKMGLNVVEHGARNDLYDLLQTMEHNMLGDRSARAEIDQFTETGVIAFQYNRVLDQCEDAINSLKTVNDELTSSKFEAEAANRTKSEFLANVSHEIRTPMNAIMGFADMLQTNIDDDQRHQAISSIHQNGSHLLAIIDDIIDQSRIEIGQMQLSYEPVSPISIFNDCMSHVGPLAQSKGLNLQFQVAGAMPSLIKMDAKRFKQVLLNLLSNAIKFTNEGQVSLRARFEEKKQGVLTVEIRDSGIGISPEKLKTLFTPFSQIDYSTTRKFGGTGLGLALSKKLVDLLGGELTVDSAVGVGSCFAITLPVETASHPIIPKSTPKPKAETSPGAPVATESLKNPYRILYVEDGLDNQRLVSFILKKAGAHVDIAENGQVALEMIHASQTQYDLVLMDMQMPILDGYAATRMLREEKFVTPIVALTAHANQGDREKCLEAGCDEYLTKPINKATLVTVINQMIEMQSAAEKQYV